MRRPVQPSIQEVHLPAPVGGLNTVAAGTAIPEGDCIQLVNMVSGEHGLRARLGYRRGSYFGTIPSARSLLSFLAAETSSTGDKLFAVTSAEIFLIPEAEESTSIVFTFGSGAENYAESGRGVSHAFTTSAGQFLLYCDGRNGYHAYTGSTDTWAAVTEGVGAGQVSGVNPANLSFVMSWKSRLWFVEKNSQNLWYLPAGAVYGVATKLPLAQGAQFRRGGPIVGAWNWTLDGGNGIDDFLVVATAGGDVAVFQGTDPADAETFSLKGTWNAGALVSGPRIATSYGGDILFLTRSGIRPLSQLVSGGDGQQTYATSKVANLFGKLAGDRGDLPGWDMCIHPGENALIVSVPKPGGDSSANYSSEQLVFSLWNRSWSRFNLPLQSMVVHRGKFHFSQPGSYVWMGEGYVDACNPLGTSFTAVQWSVLFPFSTLGTARQKQVQLLRPQLLSESNTDAVQAEARYNYNLSPIADLTEGSASGNVWDVALWDAGTWTDDLLPGSPTRGATGIGHKVAVALKGTSRSRTVLVGVDVAFTVGGLL